MTVMLVDASYEVRAMVRLLNSLIHTNVKGTYLENNVSDVEFIYADEVINNKSFIELLPQKVIDTMSVVLTRFAYLDVIATECKYTSQDANSSFISLMESILDDVSVKYTFDGVTHEATLKDSFIVDNLLLHKMKKSLNNYEYNVLVKALLTNDIMRLEDDELAIYEHCMQYKTDISSYLIELTDPLFQIMSRSLKGAIATSLNGNPDTIDISNLALDIKLVKDDAATFVLVNEGDFRIKWFNENYKSDKNVGTEASK